MSAREDAQARDRLARAKLERETVAEGHIGAVGPFLVEAFVTEYHDEASRMAVWVGNQQLDHNEMLDPASARALAHLLLAAADRCDGKGYPEAETP